MITITRYTIYFFGNEVFLVSLIHCKLQVHNGCVSCLPLDADLPPSYDIAAKLPTYEEAERVKEQHDDLVSHGLQC